MARGRFISDSIARDIKLNTMSIEAQLVYLMTIPHLDRDGMIDGDCDILWGTVCPKRRVFMDRMQTFVDEWIAAHLVISFDSDNGPVLYFKGFSKNQQGLRYDRETPSRFPVPPGFLRTPTGIVSRETLSADGSGSNPATIRQASSKPRGNVPDKVRSKAGVKPENIRSTTGVLPETVEVIAPSVRIDPNDEEITGVETDIRHLSGKHPALIRQLSGEHPEASGFCRPNGKYKYKYKFKVNHHLRATDPLEDSDPEPEKDDDAEDRNQRAAVFQCWSDNMPGTMVPLLADQLNDLIDECGAEAVIKGIGKSVTAGVLKFKYVAACARGIASGDDWKPNAPKPANGNGNGNGNGRASKVEKSMDAAQRALEILNGKGIT